MNENVGNKLIDGLSQMDKNLALVEVKGDSVQALLATRIILKELYSSLIDDVQSEARQKSEIKNKEKEE